MHRAVVASAYGNSWGICCSITSTIFWSTIKTVVRCVLVCLFVCNLYIYICIDSPPMDQTVRRCSSGWWISVSMKSAFGATYAVIQTFHNLWIRWSSFVKKKEKEKKRTRPACRVVVAIVSFYHTVAIQTYLWIWIYDMNCLLMSHFFENIGEYQNVFDSKDDTFFLMCANNCVLYNNITTIPDSV